MNENHIKAIFTAIFALISSILGVLTVPVLLMVACNVLDYATGLMASTYRAEDINSYKKHSWNHEKSEHVAPGDCRSNH